MMALNEIDRLKAKIAAGELPPDEPVFVLRARDRFAASLVRTWAIMADKHGAPHDMVAEANRLADAMEEWPTKQTPGRDETRSTRPSTAAA
jgi:hypothetical protein